MDLEALCRVAGEILELDQSDLADGRVRARPDGRTLRYYATIGLLDRPERNGRVGTYGRRHLLQTLAIKRLQAEGASLAEIQARLIGLTGEELEPIARIPRGFDLEAAIGGESTPSAATVPPRRSFWSIVPEDGDFENEAKTGQLSALRLAEEAVLLLSGDSISPEEQDELERAARPLLKALKRMNRIS